MPEGKKKIQLKLKKKLHSNHKINTLQFTWFVFFFLPISSTFHTNKIFINIEICFKDFLARKRRFPKRV